MFTKLQQVSKAFIPLEQFLEGQAAKATELAIYSMCKDDV
jgi:hypothetical protein